MRPFQPLHQGRQAPCELSSCEVHAMMACGGQWVGHVSAGVAGRCDMPACNMSHAGFRAAAVRQCYAKLQWSAGKKIHNERLLASQAFALAPCL